MCEGSPNGWSGWNGLKRAFLPVAAIGGVMAVVQYILATNRLWTLGATGAAITGLGVMFLWLRLPTYHNHGKAESLEPAGVVKVQGKSLLLSLFAYGLLVVLAFSEVSQGTKVRAHGMVSL